MLDQSKPDGRRVGAQRFFHKHRRKPYLDVACRTCGAQVGERCDMISHPTRFSTGFHRTRRFDSLQLKSQNIADVSLTEHKL